MGRYVRNRLPILSVLTGSGMLLYWYYNKRLSQYSLMHKTSSLQDAQEECFNQELYAVLCPISCEKNYDKENESVRFKEAIAALIKPIVYNDTLHNEESVKHLYLLLQKKLLCPIYNGGERVENPLYENILCSDVSQWVSIMKDQFNQYCMMMDEKKIQSDLWTILQTNIQQLIALCDQAEQRKNDIVHCVHTMFLCKNRDCLSGAVEKLIAALCEYKRVISDITNQQDELLCMDGEDALFLNIIEQGGYQDFLLLFEHFITENSNNSQNDRMQLRLNV